MNLRDQSLAVLGAFALFLAVCCLPVVALAGEISYEYSSDGDDPGTVWVDIRMDPIDWGSCTECLMPDWSSIHISPAPIDPTPGTGSYPGGQWLNLDATGGFLHGDGFTRRILLDAGIIYRITEAITRRQAQEIELDIYGNEFCNGQIGCTYEVTDYAELDVEPLTVTIDPGSFSVIKARYDR